ncbi:hypothetical protein NL364_28475, partial [Klebsiella pneumoniae]|nr:hypothetical protein [Klebsiella pneumoniae]
VDIPSGLSAEQPFAGAYTCIRAQQTFTFQRPKRSFFMPESAHAQIGFTVLDIGLDESFIEAQPTDMYLLEATDIKALLKPRLPFTHKGTY